MKRAIDWEHNWNDPEFWSRVGYIVGANIQNIFERPDEWYPYDPERNGERV